MQPFCFAAMACQQWKAVGLAHSRHLFTSSKLENIVFQPAMYHMPKLKDSNNDADDGYHSG
jgi:hypothetical protein